MNNETTRILVISPDDDSRAYMEDFFDHTTFPKPDFVVGKFAPADKYDFLIFDCRTMPLYKVNDFMELPEKDQSHFFLLDRYIRDTSKYILFFGRFYHNLNFERCPAANSKFSLYARIKELMDFIENYKQ